jgi:ABC-type multidrug transport system ATPase subunit
LHSAAAAAEHDGCTRANVALRMRTTGMLLACFPDTLLPMLTVEEMLLYTADLKRPWRQPLCEKRGDVEKLLDRLALTSCR